MLTVIDSGLPGQWDEFTKELAEMGRSLDEVRGLVLTHGDTDHIGFAERLREHGVPVYCARGRCPTGNRRGKEEEPFVGPDEGRASLCVPLVLPGAAVDCAPPTSGR